MTNGNKNLSQELKELLAGFDRGPIVSKHIERIKKGKLTIQENPKSHFCIYFAAYDDKHKELFIGHHKKSGLWLFNGGHIDEGENLQVTLKREIDEEWGLDISMLEINKPPFLTLTEIDNPAKQTCRSHYDIWYFIRVDKDSFNPDIDKVLEEFYEINWLSVKKAKEVVKEKNTLAGIDFIEEHFF
ncbi:NUDIX domain-containing protein [Candidatus Parcubacteria bacterium]|nr:NUDIX domain-containing protein [Candidatus Parcubacteria bacterium]